MIEVHLYGREVPEYLVIVRGLRDMGLSDKEFTFRYVPARWDDFSFNVTNKRHMVFTFNDEKIASWFRLKYE